MAPLSRGEAEHLMTAPPTHVDYQLSQLDQLEAESIHIFREVAAEFDGIHNIYRAVEVGSVDAVIKASRLRPEIIKAIER